ncbi:hypothetical protein ASC90_20790 [Rhizobium sp. Root1220]|nr:hypothetical protein ASC90_20790 [Rhizobium sp. Root1220]
MAYEYCLCSEGELWSIIDQATHEPARLDGIPLAEMRVDEAKHMLAILKGIDRVKAASRKSAAMGKKMRTEGANATPPLVVNDILQTLRRPMGDCSRCGLCTGMCSQKREEL